MCLAHLITFFGFDRFGRLRIFLSPPEGQNASSWTVPTAARSADGPHGTAKLTVKVFKCMEEPKTEDGIDAKPWNKSWKFIEQRT